jgi:hypothetical protein
LTGDLLGEGMPHGVRRASLTRQAAALAAHHTHTDVAEEHYSLRTRSVVILMLVGFAWAAIVWLMRAIV